MDGVSPERLVDSGWEIDWKNVFYVRLRYTIATAPRLEDVVIGEEGDGSVVRVQSGQDLVVRLAQRSAKDTGWLVIERGGLGWAYFRRLSPDSVEYRWETDHLPPGFTSGAVRFGYTAGFAAPTSTMQFRVAVQP